MNPKPETEAQSVERMLSYWYGGRSTAGAGKPNAAGTASSASSPDFTKASVKATSHCHGTEFLNETQNGISNSPKMKGLSRQLSIPARSMSDEVQDSIFDAVEVH